MYMNNFVGLLDSDNDSDAAASASTLVAAASVAAAEAGACRPRCHLTSHVTGCHWLPSTHGPARGRGLGPGSSCLI
jgi:hypothetical protein